MIATIDGVTVMGTPQEILEFKRLTETRAKNKQQPTMTTEQFIETMRKKQRNYPWEDTGNKTDTVYVCTTAPTTSWN